MTHTTTIDTSQDYLSLANDAVLLMADEESPSLLFENEHNEEQKKASKLAYQAGLISPSSTIPPILHDNRFLMASFLKGIQGGTTPDNFSELFDHTRQDSYWKITSKQWPERQLYIPKGALTDIQSVSAAHNIAFMMITPFFDRYTNYLFDPYPVGPDLGVYQIDKANDHLPVGQYVLLVDHPASGEMLFSNGIKGLREAVRFDYLLQTLDCPESTAADKEAINRRIEAISQRVSGPNFLPLSGICSCCTADVTINFSQQTVIESITGCPVCGRTWCD